MENSSMPKMGFGTYRINDPIPILNAIKNGYRHFDTASIYGNEEAVGTAVIQAASELNV